MTEFTASNGGTIRVEAGGRVTITDHTRERLSAIAETISRTAYLNKAQASALREFFQHERDEERDMWRSSKDRTWTAVRRNNTIYFQNEDHERNFWFVVGNDATLKPWSGDLQVIAREYMAVHPERKPLPEIDGIYAVSPNVHPYERLIQRRNGEWIHLRRSASEFETDNISAQSIAQSAVDEGRLTRLVAEDAS